MKFVALIGSSNTGKTTSIKMLAHEMLALGGQVGEPTMIPIQNKNNQRSCIDSGKLSKCNYDIRKHKGDITILFRWGRKHILITSFGDDESSIKTKFDLIQKNQIANDDVIFLSAAHTNDETIKYINKIAYGSTHVKIQKSTAKSSKLSSGISHKDIENIVNHETALMLLEIIKTI